MGLFGKKSDPREGYERRNSLGPLEQRRVFIADDDGELPEPRGGYTKKKKKRKKGSKKAEKPTGPVKGRAPKPKKHKDPLVEEHLAMRRAMERHRRQNVGETVYSDVRTQEGVIAGVDGKLYDQDGVPLSWWKSWLHGWIVDKEQKNNQLENPICSLKFRGTPDCNESAALHSYGLESHCRSVLRDPTTGRSTGRGECVIL